MKSNRKTLPLIHKVMKINEINIELISPKNGLIAFASVVLEPGIFLGSIGVMKRLNDDTYRLIYPTRKVGSKSLNIFFPVNSSAGKALEEAVNRKLKDVLKEDDRYHRALCPGNE